MGYGANTNEESGQQPGHKAQEQPREQTTEQPASSPWPGSSDVQMAPEHPAQLDPERRKQPRAAASLPSSSTGTPAEPRPRPLVVDANGAYGPHGKPLNPAAPVFVPSAGPIQHRALQTNPAGVSGLNIPAQPGRANSIGNNLQFVQQPQAAQKLRWAASQWATTR